MSSEIAPGVYKVTGRSEDKKKSYRTFLFTDGTPTLVDTGTSDVVEEILQDIEELGIPPERLVITHGDNDHIGGFDAVVDRYDLESWVTEQTNLETQFSPTYRYTTRQKLVDSSLFMLRAMNRTIM